jgi:uncharacterized membrane protein
VSEPKKLEDLSNSLTTLLETGDKINWKQKLTSRKFIVAVVGFIALLLAAFNIPDMRIEQVSALVTAGLTLVAYIIGEGVVDAARINANPVTEQYVYSDSGVHSMRLEYDKLATEKLELQAKLDSLNKAYVAAVGVHPDDDDGSVGMTD